MTSNIVDLLPVTQIIADMRADTRWQAIDELLDHLIATQAIPPGLRDGVASAIIKRERTMSTGIGFGIGIPHATTGLISDTVVALGRSKKGIAFDALDGQLVTLVLLFLVPSGQFQKHLHTVADIARLLQNIDTRRAVQAAPDAFSILEILRSQTVH